MCRFDVQPPVITLCLAILLSSLATAQKSQPQEGVSTVMRNVHYHFTDSIDIDIALIVGRLLPQPGFEIPIFDESKSFRLAIDSARMSISALSLSHLLNDYTFSAKDAPLKKLAVLLVPGGIKVKGVLHSKGDLSFETEGAITTTPDGRIRLHASKIRAAHFPAKGIMDLLGIDIADLIKTNKVNGLTVDKDDLILDPKELFPPPKIEGRVSAVVVRGDSLVLTFGALKALPAPPSKVVRNYMAYSGGRLRFGKLTMSDTDLVLIDADQRDPFDFYLGHYQQQLVAGYSKTTTKNGLMVYMPDYSKVPRQKR